MELTAAEVKRSLLWKHPVLFYRKHDFVFQAQKQISEELSLGGKKIQPYLLVFFLWCSHQ